MTFQLKEKYYPYMMGQYCMTHEMNLDVQLLSNLPMVAKLEDFLQSLYSYFSSSPKQHLEFIKLANIMETKKLNLRNVKTPWINMLEPLKHVMVK
jgi:hypothetical protein